MAEMKLIKDKTFTCTLFAPTSELERLTSRAAASTWFKRHFVDAVHIIGEETLLDDFDRNPRSWLISLKVRSEMAPIKTGGAERHPRRSHTTTRIAASYWGTQRIRWFR